MLIDLKNANISSSAKRGRCRRLPASRCAIIDCGSINGYGVCPNENISNISTPNDHLQ